MEIIFIIIVIFIGFIPILYRVNKRMHAMEEKISQLKREINR